MNGQQIKEPSRLKKLGKHILRISRRINCQHLDTVKNYQYNAFIGHVEHGRKCTHCGKTLL